MYFEADIDHMNSPMLTLPTSENDCEEHIHRHLEILYVLTGKVKVTINGVQNILEEDQLSIADAYDVHAYRNIDATTVCLIIPHSSLSDFVQRKGNRALSTNFIKNKKIAIKFREILSLLQKNWKGNDLVLNGLFMTVLGLILDNVPLVDNNSAYSDSVIHEILYYIDENFTGKISLDTIAEHFHYSKSHFSSMFNTVFHVSLNEYINMLRCNYAVNLMRTQRYPILDAALTAGFSSAATFYRYFKSHFGMSPKDYVKNPKTQNIRQISNQISAH